MRHEQNSLLYKTAFSYRRNKQGKKLFDSPADTEISDKNRRNLTKAICDKPEERRL